MLWALILTVAMTLEGEAGVLGEPGMYAVADTMLCRLESPAYPDDWPAVLNAYYGTAPPSEQAIAIATEAVMAPWPSQGYPYALSREDVRRLGVQVDEWVCDGRWCIGLASEWIAE